MKTQSSNTAKSRLATLTIIIMLAFAFNSCQKDETPVLETTPAENHQFPVETINRSATTANTALAVVMVKIEHLAIKSSQADYMVTLYTDGTIIFNGRKNVKYTGIARLQATTESMLSISALIRNSNFFTMSQSTKFAEDLPVTITTCAQMQQTADVRTPAYKTKSLSDYNNGYPKALCALRMNIERQLQIQDLIGGEIINNTK